MLNTSSLSPAPLPQAKGGLFNRQVDFQLGARSAGSQSPLFKGGAPKGWGFGFERWSANRRNRVRKCLKSQTPVSFAATPFEKGALISGALRRKGEIPWFSSALDCRVNKSSSPSGEKEPLLPRGGGKFTPLSPGGRGVGERGEGFLKPESPPPDPDPRFPANP